MLCTNRSDGADVVLALNVGTQLNLWSNQV